jgi:ElaB/YqjD/DUF883 family membrane-anchored ribosome-binding protein
VTAQIHAPHMTRKENSMSEIKHIKDVSQDFAENFAALRDDVAKLTTSVTELLRSQASTTTGTVMEAVKDAGQKLSDSTTEAQNRLRGMGSDIEATIERNPLAAVLIALSAGLIIGMVTGLRR